MVSQNMTTNFLPNEWKLIQEVKIDLVSGLDKVLPSIQFKIGAVAESLFYPLCFSRGTYLLAFGYTAKVLYTDKRTNNTQEYPISGLVVLEIARLRELFRFNSYGGFSAAPSQFESIQFSDDETFLYWKIPYPNTTYAYSGLFGSLNLQSGYIFQNLQADPTQNTPCTPATGLYLDRRILSALEGKLRGNILLMNGVKSLDFQWIAASDKLGGLYLFSRDPGAVQAADRLQNEVQIVGRDPIIDTQLADEIKIIKDYSRN